MTPISFRISNHMRVYQDVVVGITGRKVMLMYQQREKFNSLNSLHTSSAKRQWPRKKSSESINFTENKASQYIAKGRTIVDPALHT